MPASLPRKSRLVAPPRLVITLTEKEWAEMEGHTAAAGFRRCSTLAATWIRSKLTELSAKK